MSKLVDIYKRQVANKLTTSSVPISEGQISNLDSTDPAKQTVNQGKLVGDTKLAQHLVPHEPTR